MFALLPVEFVIGPVLQTSPLLFERAHGYMWKTWVGINSISQPRFCLTAEQDCAC